MIAAAGWIVAGACLLTLVSYHVVDAIEWRRLKRQVRPSIEASKRQPSLAAEIARLEAEVARLQCVADCAVTIADEAFGPFPVEPIEETLMRIERGIFEMRRSQAAER